MIDTDVVIKRSSTNNLTVVITLVITLFYLIHAGVLMANAQVGTEHIST